MKIHILNYSTNKKLGHLGQTQNQHRANMLQSGKECSAPYVTHRHLRPTLKLQLLIPSDLSLLMACVVVC